MNENIVKMVALLNELLKLHRALYDCACRLNGAIKSKQTAAVHRLVTEYDQAVFAIQELEEKRLVLCDSVGKDLGINSRHCSISAIVTAMPKAMPAAEQSELLQLRDSLKSVLNELHKINCSNKILLEEELVMIAQTMELVTKTDTKFCNYRSAGHKAPQPTTRTLFNKIA